MIRARWFALSILVVGALVACDGATVMLGELDKRSSPVTGSDDASADSGSIDPLAECDQPMGPLHAFTSVADTEARIQGTWLKCSGRRDGLIPPPNDEPPSNPADSGGLHFATTRATFLLKDGDELALQADVTYRRKVAIPAAGRVDLTCFTCGQPTQHVVSVAESGSSFELTMADSMPYKVRYVRASSPPKPASGDVGCVVDDPHVYSSVSDVVSRISGRWELCAGRVNSPTDAKGLELAPPRAYFLVDTAGALVRGVGFGYALDIEVIDAGSGFGKYQVIAAGNNYWTYVSEDGAHLMLLELTALTTSQYRRVP